jgi:Fic family protein
MADKTNLATALANRPGDWLSIAQVRSVVGGVPERTLRRWLAELVDDGAAERAGDRKGTRYRWRNPAAAGNPPASTSTPATIFTPESAALIRRIDAPLYTRAPATYSESWIDGYIPNRTSYLSAGQRAELHALGKRPPIFGKAGTYIQKIYNRLLIDLSYNSARLEGNTYTLADTEQLVIQGVAAPGKPNAERIMILNHREAIRYLVQNVETLEVSEETIRTLHYLLADSLVGPGMAGQIRDDGIAVSGTTYAPLEGRERLAILLSRLIDKAKAVEDPFEQSFFLLGHISYLQAFVDVNKRTARLASIIPLIRKDFVPQSFVDVDKNDYLKATIVLYELNEVSPLVDVYCWAYRRSCLQFDTFVDVVGFDEIAATYRSQRRSLVADMVRAHVPIPRAPTYIESHMPPQIEPLHRDKFMKDVLAELAHLDGSRIGGLGLTREELVAWLKTKDGDAP